MPQGAINENNLHNFFFFLPCKIIHVILFVTVTCILELFVLIHVCACVVGAPSPAGHLSTASVRGEEGQHGDPCARSREQHRLLRLTVPWRLQDAKAAHSHTA